MAWSVLDLSIITDELIGLLRETVAPASTVWTNHGGPIDFFHVTVSGAMPEADRDSAECVLSLYLLHVSQDPHVRNTPVSGPVPQVNRSQPLSLHLYYLLTSFANKNYNQEQQAMSIAMRCFHERAIMRVLAPQPPQEPRREYTITMEVQTADEMSWLWQALSTPYRLSVVYKVSIVFVTPSVDPVTAKPVPTAVGLAVVPQSVASPEAPARIFGVAVRESFAVPEGATAAHADMIPSSIVPGLVRPGEDLIVTGDGFELPAFAKVYLTAPGPVETEITAWRQGPASASTLRVRFPKDPAAVPPAPPPGTYLLTVGSDGPKVRTNAATVAVAARIDGLATPPELTPDGAGLYTVQGAGFTPALTEVRLGDVPLTRVAAAPNAGEFQVAPDGTSFTFKAPNALPKGRYFMGVSVNQIASPPSWYVVL